MTALMCVAFVCTCFMTSGNVVPLFSREGGGGEVWWYLVKVVIESLSSV
jgi:hypothetical protein